MVRLTQHGAAKAAAIATRECAGRGFLRVGTQRMSRRDRHAPHSPKRTFTTANRVSIRSSCSRSTAPCSASPRVITRASSRATKSPRHGLGQPSLRSPMYTQRRTMATVQDQRYEAVVVGAGPAGITCVGNLLERKLSPILWVDGDGFNGGKVNRLYREVPSNTKVKTFIDYAMGVSPFRRIISGMPARSRWDEPGESDSANTNNNTDKLHVMRQMDQEKGCRLSHAADMCLMLTDGLKRTAGVVPQKGRVAEATLHDDSADSSHWTVQVHDEGPSDAGVQSVQTKRLVLCTGSSPSDELLPVEIPDIKSLDLDTALSPSRLSAAISPLGPTTIAVIGASHSAILVLMNLYNLASTSKPDLKVRWLTRHALRYAEFMDGWILRDNTGLKGEAAEWAKANLEPEVFAQSPVSRYMSAISYDKGDEKSTIKQNLPGCNFYVQAIGYTRDPIPTLKTSSGREITPSFDHETGSFSYAEDGSSATKLPGMFGAGIAWPERVKDPYGNVEYAVGFFKFMKFVKRVAPSWN